MSSLCVICLENECSDGVKLSIDVIAAHSTSSAVQPTTAASSPMDPTGTSTPGAVIGSTGTVTGSTGTVTGSTTSSSFSMYSEVVLLALGHEYVL